MTVRPNATVDVVVVGGGLSGLVEARTVQAAGRSVRLIEAATQVGGRMGGQRVPIPAEVRADGRRDTGETVLIFGA